MPAVAALFVARGAAAREVELRIAPGCPDLSSVEARLGRAGGGGVVRVTIERRPPDFEGEVVLGEGEGRFARTVRGSTCEAVVDALALVLSLVRESEPALPPEAAPAPEAPKAPGAEPPSVAPAPIAGPDEVPPPPASRALEAAPRVRVGMGVESGMMRFGDTAYGLWGGAWFRVLPMVSVGVEAASTGRVPSCPNDEVYGGPLVVPSCKDGRSIQRFLFVPRVHLALGGTMVGVSAGPLVGVAFSNRVLDVFGFGTRQRGSRGVVWGGQAGLHVGPRWVTVDVPVTVGRAPEGLLADEATVLFTVGLGVSLHVM